METRHEETEKQEMRGEEVNKFMKKTSELLY